MKFRTYTARNCGSNRKFSGVSITFLPFRYAMDGFKWSYPMSLWPWSRNIKIWKSYYAAIQWLKIISSWLILVFFCCIIKCFKITLQNITLVKVLLLLFFVTIFSHVPLTYSFYFPLLFVYLIVTLFYKKCKYWKCKCKFVCVGFFLTFPRFF